MPTARESCVPPSRLALRRTRKPRESFPASSLGGTAYSYSAAYNADGRVDTVAYPSGLALKYVYTALGYLSQVKDNASGAAYWTVNTRDAELHLTAATFGNGVQETQAFDANTMGTHEVSDRILAAAGNDGEADAVGMMEHPNPPSLADAHAVLIGLKDAAPTRERAGS